MVAGETYKDFRGYGSTLAHSMWFPNAFQVCVLKFSRVLYSLWVEDVFQANVCGYVKGY